MFLLLCFKQACASQLGDYIEHMGITILRHFKVGLLFYINHLRITKSKGPIKPSDTL